MMTAGEVWGSSTSVVGVTVQVLTRVTQQHKDNVQERGEVVTSSVYT